jgi:hypothetical protein
MVLGKGYRSMQRVSFIAVLSTAAVPADEGFHCDTAAVPGDTIKETDCVIVTGAYNKHGKCAVSVFITW